MAAAECTAPQTRAQDALFVQHCSFEGLRSQLPLRWPRTRGLPDSPKKRYRSQYVYAGGEDLNDLTNWGHLSSFDLVLRLVDFSPLRATLAWLLGWTSPRGKVPFDPLSFFLLVGWQVVQGWSRAETLRNIRQPRYADYAAAFGFQTTTSPQREGYATF